MRRKTLIRTICGEIGVERSISVLAAAILLVTALAAGAVVFAVLGQHFYRELQNGLQRTHGDKAILIHNEIDDAGERATNISKRFLLTRLMQQVSDGSAPEGVQATIGAILENAMVEHKLSMVALYDINGREIAVRGRQLPQGFFLPLDHPAGTSLLWRDGYHLAATLDIRSGDQPVGTIRLEKPLPALTRAFQDYHGLGSSGESVLCGAASPERMHCFPSRNHPEPFEAPRQVNGVDTPLSLALGGKSGVITALDYRGKEVFDAYSPLGDSGLGLVVKIDTAELVQPLRADFLWVAPFLVVLLVIGFALLRWRVGPLVREMVSAKARVHGILDNSADGIITIDERGMIESFNYAAARIFGYSVADVLGRNVNMLMPESYRAMHDEGIRNYLRSGEAKVIGHGARTVEGQHKDGRVFPMELTLGEMVLEGKRLFIASVRDTSALKQAHDELRSNFGAMQLAKRELEEAHALLKQAEQDQNRQMNALAEANVRMVLFHTNMERVWEAEEVLAANHDIETFHRSILADAINLVGARYGAVGLFDRTGRLQKFLTHGISEEAREKIGPYPTGKGLLQAFYQERKIVRVNHIADDPRACGFPPGHPEMRSLLGVPLVVGSVTRGVIYLADKNGDEPFTEQDEMLMEMVAREVEHVLERNELLGILHESNQALTQEREEQGKLIEQLKSAQSQLLQSEKMASIGQLAAGVAHEINNPIGYVHSNLGTLEKYIHDLFSVLDQFEAAESELPPGSASLARIRAHKEVLDLSFLREDIPSLMNESKEGVSRVKKIVQDLKDFSHVDEAEWQWCDLQKGLDSTLNIVWNELKYKAEVVKEYGALPEVECIPSQLNQVFMNLLVNAGHAIEEKGLITIRTGQDGDEVWVEVTDNGKGIAPEHLSRIFDPFFTTKPVGKGTGLGLSLSYGIVQKHHGRIEVDSTPGMGTTFRVRLPVKQMEKAS